MVMVQELLHAGDVIPGDNGRRDIEILLCHVLKQSRTWLYTWPEHEIHEPSEGEFRQLLARRRAGEPIAYLTGERAFWTLQLAVDESTLIPRHETELLVSWTLELALPDDAQVMDLGTGSGAIALALASERQQWQVTAVDSCERALAVARTNAGSAQLANVSFQQSDWYSALGDLQCHIIVSNPPYIDEDDEHLGQGDLRFEPRSALVAQQNGMADLATLIAGAGQHLLPGGWLLLEHGCEQGKAVRVMLYDAGFKQVTTRCDLAGLERSTGACWHVE